ncbi:MULTISPECIES: DUF3099 domain-containing protein [Pseudonocardia]|uniref:DUF3099 domain-containing protein n=2 Tax=Pseudonocardia TaxID=1847 RepID=A0A1Y2MK82_PSEAH|nr:DUF3099 domain-containing protein [Pseudonocardia saturnea]OSY35419.1 hypothetical protein BG845_06055 [Pseudonocardia autotrophica]TDN72171.1 hypothetical protein C8E95_1223 [Pseudonocardia autotrophica]BBG02877.1 hypothetical protein Pdca_40860 [Pseudonocardia autotrophica]GEC27659.1 hypothetical protein PSA01_46880 [Pseudonocardia saturnea]
MSDQRREDPVLITDAQMSYDEELEVRKRRYKWTMGLRIPCMILAGVFYQIPWLAVTLLAISVPLPWIAVLVANDRLPRRVEKPNRYRHEHRAIEERPHPVVEPGGDSPEQDGERRSNQAGKQAGEPGSKQAGEQGRKQGGEPGSEQGSEQGREQSSPEQGEPERRGATG